ncbi:MAG: FHA domain-containing protein [Anaerolineales bacterium]|nr:FHA domain-containing protein [Anaerolineales bacterium]MCB0006884.1 FHA domain-containing protein [Anaerolineales bacterium]MCB0012108.1 FHA domain-containing protein [Anaerolineales bacterium]
MSENPVLIAREGQLAGQRWTVDSQDFVIGRGSDCNIVLPERQVSRHHVRISYDGSQYHLYALGKNGTHVNGRQVDDQTVIRDGDEIQIALCVKLLFIGTDATLPLTFEMPREAKALVLDESARTVSINDKTLDPPLSLAQFRLLKLLFDAEGAVCVRNDIVDEVWPGTGGSGVSEQAIDALVRRLRDRLGELSDFNFIVTVRGHGFRLDNPEVRV